MPRKIPKPVEELWKGYPTVWKAFKELGSRCHEAGPLDEKSRRLVKLALSIGAGLEGATQFTWIRDKPEGSNEATLALSLWQGNLDFFSPTAQRRDPADPARAV